MNATERLDAAIHLRPVDRVPNAPFYEAPICAYLGNPFRSALLGGRPMAEVHLAALEHFCFDWVMVGMGLIGGIIPEALGCHVTFPENVFPIIEGTLIKSETDLGKIEGANIHTERMELFLEGVSLMRDQLKGEVPIACEYISPFSIAVRLRGTNEIMTDFYDSPALIHRLQRILMDLDVEVGKALIEAGVDYIFYGADMECPLLISPKHYRDFVHEPTRQVVNALADMGAKVLPHMCGQIITTGIVDLLLEMNIQGIMPGNLTQDTVLDIMELKKMVSERICIFDNLNPNGSLLNGTPKEVEEETKTHLERARSMKGYAFSTSGTTSPLIPRENFEAMNKIVLNFR
jgi:uroporphyrinogen decarboxylase